MQRKPHCKPGMPLGDTTSSMAECVILRQSKMSALETMEFLPYEGGMCSEVIALSTGACPPLVGSGSTRQEISSGPPIQITFQQLPSSPLREEFVNVRAAQPSRSRWPLILNALLDLNLLILDFQWRDFFFSLRKEIKYFLTLSDFNPSKLHLIPQATRWNPADRRAAHPVGSRVDVRVNKSICLCVLGQSLRDMTSVHLTSDSADRRGKGGREEI